MTGMTLGLLCRNTDQLAGHSIGIVFCGILGGLILAKTFGATPIPSVRDSYSLCLHGVRSRFRCHRGGLDPFHESGRRHCGTLRAPSPPDPGKTSPQSRARYCRGGGGGHLERRAGSGRGWPDSRIVLHPDSPGPPPSPPRNLPPPGHHATRRRSSLFGGSDHMSSEDLGRANAPGTDGKRQSRRTLPSPSQASSPRHSTGCHASCFQGPIDGGGVCGVGGATGDLDARRVNRPRLPIPCPELVYPVLPRTSPCRAVLDSSSRPRLQHHPRLASHKA